MNDFINLKHLEDDIRVHYNKKMDTLGQNLQSKYLRHTLSLKRGKKGWRKETIRLA